MEKRRHFKSVLFLLLAIVLMLGVDGGTISKVEAASKIKINRTKASIYIGKTVQLRIKGTKSKVKWSSANKDIASVNSKGKVKGKKVGKTNIIAKVGRKNIDVRLL